MGSNVMKKILASAILVLAGTHLGTGAQASCRSEVGDRKANIYVQQCTEVSPATHPPCNAENSCALIIAEIKRSCAMLSRSEAPAFCRNYK
jgi:hypothetical protein